MTTEKSSYSKLFWVTCRQCKHKFGVSPKYVMLYVERIMRGRKDEDVTAGLEDAQEEIEEVEERPKTYSPRYR